MIQALNITYQAKEKTLLRNASLTLDNGKITAILGSNGAGKSTLLKCLSGGLTPTNGSIMLEDKALQTYPLRDLAKKRAVLSQSPEIGFPFTVLEIVLMGRAPHQQNPIKDHEIAIEALQLVDAANLKDRLLPTLSGGEQQRVHLARVLAQLWEQQDCYLFLDEPTSALDIKHQHQVLELLKRARSFTKHGHMPYTPRY